MSSLIFSMVVCAAVNFWYGYRIKNQQKIQLIPINLYRNVPQENMIPFTSLMGLSNYITGGGFVVSVALFSISSSVFLLMFPALSGVVGGYIVTKMAQKKYSTNA